MATGSSNMTTYKASQVIGNDTAQNPAGALLQSGAGRADNSTTGDTWIFLDTPGGTASPWGIKHAQGDNKIKIIGNGTDGFWVKMNTGITYILGKVGIGYDPETSGNDYKLYVNGTSYFNGSVTSTGTFYSTASPGFQNVTNAGTWAYLQLKSGTSGWDIAVNSSSNSGALDFRPHTNTSKGIMISQNGDLYFQNNATNGIYYNGTKAAYRMIRFIDNTSGTDGNGISIGGGGLAIFGSGESADTMVSQLGYTGGSEVTVIASDGSIFFYPGQQSYDASAKLEMTASRFWAGVNGDTTREAQVGCQSGAGQVYLWSAASATGDRGLYLPAHGDGSAYSLIRSNSNNVSNLNVNYIGVRNTDSTTGHGLSLYNGPVNGQPTYGIMFAGTSTFGKCGDVSNDWATYFTMNRNDTRGWIFKSDTGTNGNYASISGRGHFTGTLTPSSWIDGQRYTYAAYNITDYSNTGSYNPWIRATNTWSSGESSAKVGRWFSFGTLGTSFYWIGSTTSRTTNSYDRAMIYNISNGNLSVDTINNFVINVRGTTVLNANDVRTSNGIWVCQAAITNAAITNHGILIGLASVGTPSQIYIPDSSHLYVYKRWYSSSAWSGWSKLSAGYADSAGSVAWANVSDKPATATRWPSWSEVTSKPSTFAPSSHTHSYLPLSGGQMTGTITMTTAPAAAAASTPTALSYGRLQCYGTLWINANTDNSGTEYVVLTAGHGVSSTLTDGFVVGSGHNYCNQGPLHIFPRANGSSYNEGLRIHVATNNWATIMLCGSDNTGDSGTSTNSWGIFNNNGTLYINKATSSGAGAPRVYANANGWYFDKAYGAVWNDFAEFRQADINEPGRVIIPSENGIAHISDKRLQPNGRIISDTYGFSVGASDKAKTPVGISGRVLAYPYQNIENYKIGDAVCSAPNGTVDIMTREEIKEYPDRIIGIVNEIPMYDIWEESLDCPGGEPTTTKICVNGRIWIDIK